MRQKVNTMKVTFSGVNTYLTPNRIGADNNRMSKIVDKSKIIDKSYIVDTSFIDTSVIKDKVSFSGLVNR